MRKADRVYTTTRETCWDAPVEHGNATGQSADPASSCTVESHNGRDLSGPGVGVGWGVTFDSSCPVFSGFCGVWVDSEANPLVSIWLFCYPLIEEPGTSPS